MLSVFAGPILPGRRVPTKKQFTDGLKELYPTYDLTPGTGNVLNTLLADWPNERFIKTGYVNPKIKQIFEIAEKLSKPFHERLFFAGEHTRMDFFGYMEGALRSGERAANTLMLKACGLLGEPAPKSPSRPPQRPAPKPPSPPLVARTTPARETTAFEREIGFRLEEHLSTDYPGEAESPFLHREFFAERSDEELEPRAAALVAESPFQDAFGEEPGILVEPELVEANYLGEDLLAEEEFMSHDLLPDKPDGPDSVDEEEAEEPAEQQLYSSAEYEEVPVFEEPREPASEREDFDEECDDGQDELTHAAKPDEEFEFEDEEMLDILDEGHDEGEAFDISDDLEEAAHPEQFSVATHPSFTADLEEHQVALPGRPLPSADHFHKEAKRDPKTGKLVVSGTVTVMQPSTMNPDFIDPWLDDPTLDASATGLHGRLRDFVIANFAPFLDPQSVSKKRAHPTDKIYLALVDLTGGKLAAPELAEWGSTTALDGASVPKILAIYALHQLLFDLTELAKTGSIKTRTALVTAARAHWKKSGLTVIPDLTTLFSFKDQTTKPVEINFKPQFQDGRFDVNGNCPYKWLIRALGFPYIGSVALNSGLRHPKRGGLWLGTSYKCNGVDSWHNDPMPRVDSCSKKGKSGHTATALSVATYYTLLAQGRLADPTTSTAIFNRLLRGCPLSYGSAKIGPLDALNALGGVKTVARKCGLLDKCVHATMLIERDRFRYVAVILTVDAPGFRFDDMTKGMDEIIQKRNP